MGPNGLVPSLLVFGALPSFPAPATNHPNQEERFQALRLARQEMETIVAQTRIKTALRSKLPPATKYLIKPGDDVRVYRERSKRWNGPFKVTKVSDKIISVTDGEKVKQFNITSVLPMKPRANDTDLTRDMSGIERYYLITQDESQYPSEILNKSDPRYTCPSSLNAIKQEIEGLLARNAFEFTKLDKIPKNANILGGRFILAIKQPGTTNERYKARFVVQGHKDREKEYIVHTSRTIRHKNIRIMLTITASLDEYTIWLQDVTQAYIQGYDLQRDVYITPSDEFKLPKDMYLKLLKPLYGLSESGHSWFQKYTNFLKEDLKLTATDGDQSFLFKKKPKTDELQGTLAVYVDDTLASGNKEFLKLTDKIEEKF